jgi:hypothetical protein
MSSTIELGMIQMVCALAIVLCKVFAGLYFEFKINVLLVLSSILFFVTGLLVFFSGASRSIWMTAIAILLSIVSAVAAVTLPVCSFFALDWECWWPFGPMTGMSILAASLVMLTCSINSSCLAYTGRPVPVAPEASPALKSQTNNVYHQPGKHPAMPQEAQPPPYHTTVLV